MSTINRFLSHGDDTHINSTEKTLSDVRTILETGPSISGDVNTILTDVNIPSQTSDLNTFITNANLFNIISDVNIPSQSTNIKVITDQTDGNILAINNNTSTIATNTTNINNKLPSSIGQKNIANSLSVTLPSDQPILQVQSNSINLASETTVSNINNKIPNIGQQTSVGSLSVVQASDNTFNNIVTDFNIPSQTSNVKTEVVNPSLQEFYNPKFAPFLDTNLLFTDGTANFIQQGNEFKIETLAGQEGRLYSDNLGLRNGQRITYTSSFDCELFGGNNTYTYFQGLSVSSFTGQNQILVGIKDGFSYIRIRKNGVVNDISSSDMNGFAYNFRTGGWNTFKIILYCSNGPYKVDFYTIDDAGDSLLAHSFSDNSESFQLGMPKWRFWAGLDNGSGDSTREVRLAGVLITQDILLSDLGKGVVQSYTQKVCIADNDTNISSIDRSLRNIDDSSITPQFQYNFKYSINPRLFISNLLGSGTNGVTNNHLQLTAPSNTNSISQLTSKPTLHYRNGQIAIWRGTVFIGSSPDVNSYALWGIGDRCNSNGSNIVKNFIGFQLDDIGLACVIRNNASTDYDFYIKSYQTGWDSNEVFSEPIDPLAGNVYQVKFLYLGYALVEWSMFDPNKGRFVVLNVYTHSNNSFDTFVDNPILSAYYGVKNVIGTSTTVDLRAHSVMLGINGKNKNTTPPRSIKITGSAVGDGTYVGTLRCADLFNSKTNFSRIFLKHVNIVCTNSGSNTSSIEFWKNTTLNTPTWSDYESNVSLLQTLNTGTVTADTGRLMIGVVVANNSENDDDLDNIYLEPDSHVSLRLRTTGGNSTFTMYILFEEDF